MAEALSPLSAALGKRNIGVACARFCFQKKVECPPFEASAIFIPTRAANLLGPGINRILVESIPVEMLIRLVQTRVTTKEPPKGFTLIRTENRNRVDTIGIN